MPIHDWTRVDAGVFHDFHGVWIAEIRQAMNSGGLPAAYYAQIEQHSDDQIVDVLTLHASSPTTPTPPMPTGNQVMAVLERPPLLTLFAKASRRPRMDRKRKYIAVRHISGHRVVAILEIVSSGNKDRRSHVREFVNKIRTAIRHGIHAVTIDLFPPTPTTPRGLHVDVWRAYGSSLDALPADRQRCVASYIAKSQPETYAEYLGVGDELPQVPLFLSDGHYVTLPLQETYARTFAGTPMYVRELLAAP